MHTEWNVTDLGEIVQNIASIDWSWEAEFKALWEDSTETVAAVLGQPDFQGGWGEPGYPGEQDGLLGVRLAATHRSNSDHSVA
jgi:hypothetical protein